MKALPDKAFIAALRIGPEKNFCYMIMCTETFETALIDPAFDYDHIVTWVSENSKDKATVSYLLATHGHWDHARGMNKMLKFYPAAKVVAHKLEEKRCGELEVLLDLKVSDQDVLKLGRLNIRCIHLPGHTEGGLGYQVGDQIFTGDTLFIGQCGRTDLSGGSDKKLFESLQKLKELDPQLIVRPGHDYGPKPMTTLLEQCKTNPTMLAKNLAEFTALP